MKVKNVEVRGQQIGVDVDNQGTFSAKVGDATVSADSLKDLIGKLERATKIEQARVSIQFSRWDDGAIKHGTVTGIHAANNNLLIKWDGVKGTSQEWRSGRWGEKTERFLRLTDVEEKQLLALYKAEEVATEAREEFEKRHAFDIGKELTKALSDAEVAA